MSDEGMTMNLRIKLSAMMFLQFMMFAVWWVPLGAYMAGTLKLSHPATANIFNTISAVLLVAYLVLFREKLGGEKADTKAPEDAPAG